MQKIHTGIDEKKVPIEQPGVLGRPEAVRTIDGRDMELTDFLFSGAPPGPDPQDVLFQVYSVL